MRSIFLTTVLAGLGVSGAVAHNEIREWGDNDYVRGIHYSIVQDGFGNDIAVLIHKGSVWNDLWRFESFDNHTNAPGDIEYIRIQPTCTVGAIQLLVIADGREGRQYAARHVKDINLLANADNITKVFSIMISGDFGEPGDMWANHVGSVSMQGDLLGWITPTDDITGNISIGGDLLASINADLIGGSVTVGGAGPHTGTITSKVQNFSDSITLGGPMEGDLIFNNSMNGTIVIQGDMSGSLEVKESFAGGAARFSTQLLGKVEYPLSS